MNDALKELEAVPQWIAFRKVWKQERGRYTKLPIDIHTGKGDHWNTPAAWASYQEVYNYVLMHELICSIPKRNLGGVGFVFTENDCYAGIDLDHVIHDGKLIPEAAEIVALMDSYTEYSLSGDGLHILFKLNAPLDTLGFNLPHELNLGVASNMGIYDKNKFFTVSDRPYGELKPIAERTEQCKQVCAELSAQRQQQTTQQTTIPDRPKDAVNWKYNPDNYHPFASPSVATHTKDLSDTELWDKMFYSAHGADIQALYNGDISGHGNDHSRADLALCSYLNYWTDSDASRIDRMFRQSGLIRPKWDELRGSNTYGQITIEHAINGEGNAYIASEGITDSSKPNISTSMHAKEQSLPQERGNLDAYLSKQFNLDILAFARFKNRKTGFDNFDRFNALYPGLYILGGVSGCGKTTFLHQISDFMAANGEYILFFSLEQKQFELASKGLSRITALDNSALAKTALDIRNGKITDAVQRAIRTYQSYGERIHIIEGGFDFSVDTLIATVNDFIVTTGRKPVVVLDYLQILRPSAAAERKAYREAIDDTIHALKKLQVDHSLLMFVISSFNRENYLSSADFSAFKESGLIEFSADVVMALQLLAMRADILDSANKLAAKRAFINSEKQRDIRDVELVTLKNRYGKAFARYFFTYDAAHDLFVPNDISEDDADTMINERAKPFESKRKNGDDDSANSGSYHYGKGH